MVDRFLEDAGRGVAGDDQSAGFFAGGEGVEGPVFGESLFVGLLAR